jgi:hypothetical protein
VGFCDALAQERIGVRAVGTRGGDDRSELVAEIHLLRERRDAALERECAHRDLPALRPGAPMMLSAAVRAASKNVSLNSASPVISRIGRRLMPGCRIGTSR